MQHAHSVNLPLPTLASLCAPCASLWQSIRALRFGPIPAPRISRGAGPAHTGDQTPIGKSGESSFHWSHMTPRRPSFALMAAVVLWLGAIAAGMAFLVSYSQKPGSVGDAPEQWPVDAGLARPPGTASLVVFLHPECPCSRATVAELARVTARMPRPTEVTVCFLRPDEWTEAAVKGSLWQAAARIPGVKVRADLDGKIARRFGAETSGTIALYDAHGALAFFGGITEGRGHEGPNAAEDTLTRCLQGASNNNIRTRVYGCSIF